MGGCRCINPGASEAEGCALDGASGHQVTKSVAFIGIAFGCSHNIFMLGRRRPLALRARNRYPGNNRAVLIRRLLDSSGRLRLAVRTHTHHSFVHTHHIFPSPSMTRLPSTHDRTCPHFLPRCSTPSAHLPIRAEQNKQRRANDATTPSPPHLTNILSILTNRVRCSPSAPHGCCEGGEAGEICDHMHAIIGE